MSGRKILIIWGTFSAGLLAGHFALAAWGFWPFNAAALAVAACAALVAWIGRRKG